MNAVIFNNSIHTRKTTSDGHLVRMSKCRRFEVFHGMGNAGMVVSDLDTGDSAKFRTWSEIKAWCNAKAGQQA